MKMSRGDRYSIHHMNKINGNYKSCHHKIRILISVLLAVILCVSAVFAEGDEAVRCKSGTLVTPIGDLEAEAPEIEAKAAALYSLDLGDFVYAKDPDRVVEPYSTTKLLTCWLALENLDPDQTVTVSEDATQTYENGTTILLRPGEEITVRDLLYGAMLESGNDAAYALGEAVSGSESAFADLMNETVKEWGCENTHFVNANGWKNEEHYTTAHDLALITAKCLENEELRKISVTETYTIPETNMSPERELENIVLAVTENPKGLTGGKTGTWSEDDCGIVVSFKRQGLSAVIVLLGDTKDGRTEDVKTLMKFSHEVTPGFAVPAEGSTVETARVRHGEKTKTELATNKVTYAYPAGNTAEEITTEAVYDKLEAPLKKGDEVGEFHIYAGDKLIGKQKLVMTEDIETGWLPSYIYISNKTTKMIIGAILILIILILLLRLYNKSRRRKRRQRAIARAAAASTPSQQGGSPANQDSRQRQTEKKISSESTGQSRREKKEARKRLREKYRGKH